MLTGPGRRPDRRGDAAASSVRTLGAGCALKALQHQTKGRGSHMLSSPVNITTKKVCGFCFGSSLELLAVDALPHGSRFETITIGTAHMHSPA